MTDDWLTVLVGDCREQMATMEAESVQCVVTSPPYWQLRDYGTAEWLGGDPTCSHQPTFTPRSSRPAGRERIGRGGAYADAQDIGAHAFRRHCKLCGAERQDGQIGLEPTPELYVATIVDVFRAVRRVLRPDGVAWLNIGDSYSGNTSHAGNGLASWSAENARGGGHRPARPKPDRGSSGLAAKQLVGIPWRTALALQADGWWLRADVIWHKPNAMPESVTDRPSTAHEYVFLLAKGERYWYDHKAVRQPATKGDSHAGARNYSSSSGRERLAQSEDDRAEGRNLRSVWAIPTQPYAGQHFAAFPEQLAATCILAGCPEGGVVLDPFAGTGTVGQVANRLSRRAVLIDLSPEYIGQLQVRTQQRVIGL